MTRDELIHYIRENYRCDVDYPWEKYPDYLVIRRRDNKKWFAGIFAVNAHQLGIDSNDRLDVVNLKCDVDLIPAFLRESHIYPAYHMNKRHWISVDIERYANTETLNILVDMSYRLVGKVR